MDLQYLRPTRVEIDLNNLEHNIWQIKKLTSPGTRICAVIKADAYGHGAVETARIAISCGVEYLAVAILDEALELRAKGIDAPILILGFTPEQQFDKIVAYDITQTVYSLKSALALSKEAVKHGKNAKIHIKLDTGMSRIGFQAVPSSIFELEKLFLLDGIQVEGIFTHFSKAEDGQAFTLQQYEKFRGMVEALEDRGFKIPIKHVSNSAATLRFPPMHLDMVRPGLILYGLLPSSDGRWRQLGLKPVMTWKTSVSHVKTLPAGRAISYGGEFITSRPSVMATLPVGYADGFDRGLSSEGKVLIKGQRAPIVGKICMDQFMVDVTDIKEAVQVGDEVVLMGDMGAETITADDIAQIIGTINYEVVCSVSRRVPRVYIRHGKIVKINNMLEL